MPPFNSPTARRRPDVLAQMLEYQSRGPKTVTSGVIPLTEELTYLSVTGTKAFSLANGLWIGQRKRLICVVAASSPVGTVTPATGFGITTLSVTAAGQVFDLSWTASGWAQANSAAASSTSTNWTTQTVAGAAVTDVDFTSVGGTAINGETDGGYEFEGYIISSAGLTLDLQPNQVSINQAGRRIVESSGTPAGAAVSSLLLGTVGAAAPRLYFRGKMSSKSGIRRWMRNEYTWFNGGNHEIAFVSSEWNDTATAITNLRFHSSAASGIGIGSSIAVRRLGSGLF